MNDTWETPKEIFDPLNKVFKFDIDVAAILENRKLDNYFGPDHVKEERRDALKAGWNGMTCWCNPPYSKPLPWVRKAVQEAYSSGATTVMLLPVDTSTVWFRELFLSSAVSKIWLLSPRVKFVGAPGSPRWANMIVVFEPKPPGMYSQKLSVEMWLWKEAQLLEKLQQNEDGLWLVPAEPSVNDEGEEVEEDDLQTFIV